MSKDAPLDIKTPLATAIAGMGYAPLFARYKRFTGLPYRSIFRIYRTLGGPKFRAQLFLMHRAKNMLDWHLK